MSEVINSIFGRSQNDTTHHGGFVPTSTTAHTAEPDVTQEFVGTAGIAVDETVEPAGEATTDVAGDADLTTGTAHEDETTGSLTEDTAETEAADTAEDTDEATTDDSAGLDDEDGELAEDPESDDDNGDLAEGSESTGDASELAEEAEIVDEDEPVEAAVETDDDPVAETDDEPADEAAGPDGEPVAEAAEADDAPAAAVAETGEDETEQAEPVAEARAAAATRGDTTVEDGVVAKVVDLLVRQVEGVHSLEDTNISVEGDVVTIKVSVVLEFGHAVKAVAGQIRTSVIDAVEEFLGLDVAAVDVHVTDVHLPDAS
ncbi:Asp23/Gls24 family envelope stress response protein [Amycolatopsis pigmentata]|uniref:Asp23/Gls24 family envelope stress response protein n=1 Tax=Amycolatopsis pigmentata TaxID=450801 RepID=A0ABW5FQC0_9PSEU